MLIIFAYRGGNAVPVTVLRPDIEQGHGEVRGPAEHVARQDADRNLHGPHLGSLHRAIHGDVITSECHHVAPNGIRAARRGWRLATARLMTGDVNVLVGAAPDHHGDFDVTERDEAQRDDEHVGRQPGDVEFALPFGGVALGTAGVFRTAVGVLSNGNLRALPLNEL